MRPIIHFELRTNSVFFSEYIHKIYGAPTVVLWEKAPRFDTGIGGRNGASRVRSREFMATGLRDRRRNVGCVCACQPAREKETHRCRRFVPRRAFSTIRGTFQRDQR